MKVRSWCFMYKLTLAGKINELLKMRVYIIESKYLESNSLRSVLKC